MMRAPLEEEIEDLAEALVRRAKEGAVSLATAESLTAGLISATIASVAGASEVLNGGAATYTEQIKHDVLGVSWDTLNDCTAVSAACAAEMAAGARRVFSADLAVSATGYAGPGGGTEADPVGTVYIGLADRRETRTMRCTFEGDRNTVRLLTVRRALQLLSESLA